MVICRNLFFINGPSWGVSRGLYFITGDCSVVVFCLRDLYFIIGDAGGAFGCRYSCRDPYLTIWEAGGSDLWRYFYRLLTMLTIILRVSFRICKLLLWAIVRGNLWDIRGIRYCWIYDMYWDYTFLYYDRAVVHHICSLIHGVFWDFCRSLEYWGGIGSYFWRLL